MRSEPRTPQRGSEPRHRAGADALLACVMLAVCAGIIAGLSWTRPTTAAGSLAYTQVGRLSYSAGTDPQSVYGGSGVSTGQPVYGSAVNALDVSYAYQFRTTAAADISGTEQLRATIGDGQGLTQTLALQAQAASFKGSRFTARGTLELSALKRAAAAFEEASGVLGAAIFPVTISPSVTVQGRVGGQAMKTTFSEPINFTYTSGNLLPGTASGGTQPSFTSSASGSVVVPGGKQATLLAGIPVASARVGSLVLLTAALILGGLAGWPLLRRATSEHERDRIAARYGAMIVEADAVAPHPGVTVVQLVSFDDLLRVARRLESPILHWGDVGDVYAVVDSGTLYRYRAGVAWATELVEHAAPKGAAVDGQALVGHPAAPPSGS